MAGEIGGDFDGMPRQSRIFFIASGRFIAASAADYTIPAICCLVLLPIYPLEIVEGLSS